VRIIGLLLTLLLTIVGIAFAALNANAVHVNYLIGSSELPLIVILLVSFFMGILMSMLILGTSLLKVMAKNKWLKHKLTQR